MEDRGPSVRLPLHFLNSHFHSLHVSNEVHWDSNLVTLVPAAPLPSSPPSLLRLCISIHTWTWHVRRHTHTHTYKCLALSIWFIVSVLVILRSCTDQAPSLLHYVPPHFLSPCLYSLLLSSSSPSASSFPFSLLIIRQQKHGASCCRGMQMVFCSRPRVLARTQSGPEWPPQSASKSQGIVEAVSSRIEQLRSVEKQLPPPPPPPPRGFSTTALGQLLMGIIAAAGKFSLLLNWIWLYFGSFSGCLCSQI